MMESFSQFDENEVIFFMQNCGFLDSLEYLMNIGHEGCYLIGLEIVGNLTTHESEDV